MHITIIVNKFIGIYLRSQVSVYRTIGPLVLHEENKIDYFFYLIFFFQTTAKQCSGTFFLCYATKYFIAQIDPTLHDS